MILKSQKKFWGTFIISILSVTLLLLGCTAKTGSKPNASPQATDKTTEDTSKPLEWSLATASSGSAPYVEGGMFVEVINKNQDKVKLSAQVTPGWVKNIPLINSGEMQLGQVTVKDMNDAYAGKENFNGQKYENIRGLFTYDSMPICLVTLSDKIKDVPDLKGKKVQIGSPGSACADISKLIIEGYGMKTDDIEILQYTTSQGADALKNGQIDAAFISGTPPVSLITDLSINRKTYILGLKDEVMNKIKAESGGALGPGSIKGGIYKGVDNDVPTLEYRGAWMANKDLSEDAVYTVVKAVWDNVEQLQQMHQGLKGDYGMKIEKIVEGIQVPLHPGAEKYYKEKGIIK